MELRGTKGTMFITPAGWEVVPEEINETAARRATTRSTAACSGARSVAQDRHRAEVGQGQRVGRHAPHARNFLDCVKSRGKCNADILTGHLSTSATLIANIALRTESLLKWDARAERFTNNPAANRLLHYEYRAPYRLA